MHFEQPVSFLKLIPQAVFCCDRKLRPFETIDQYFISWVSLPLKYPLVAVPSLRGVFQLCASTWLVSGGCVETHQNAADHALAPRWKQVEQMVAGTHRTLEPARRIARIHQQSKTIATTALYSANSWPKVEIERQGGNARPQLKLLCAISMEISSMMIWCFLKVKKMNCWDGFKRS